MSSILTNNSAMVALQTMRNINTNMAKTQNDISTGKSVATARDNAAVWAISKVMEADVKGFRAISDTLSLGSSTIAVARSASEQIADLLTEVQSKIVAAQEENVDRTKIQEDIVALRNQINSIATAAQFNGLNMLSNSDTEAGSGRVNVLSSLDRAADGSVSASQITVRKQDLGTGASAIAATGGTFAAAVATQTLNATQTGTINIATNNSGFEAGTAYAINLFGTDADDSSFTQADLRTSAAGAATQTETAANEIRYVVRDGDTAADVAAGLAAAFANLAADRGISTDVLNITANGGSLTLASGVTDATDTIQVNLVSVSGAGANNTIGGGLEALGTVDVSTQAGAERALGQIEGMIQTAIEAAASFGTAQKRIDIQREFVGNLIDSLRSGIGSLVDTDMEEASARLQALQVQQQLGIQALSIANQQPQNILALFR
ncbi:MAG: flagellin N-terminal helical domain-containing protein [Pararhodobacter sp.]